MLTQLVIQDYAIVDRLELDLTHGMTAITGETGAGKSILLGALGLCLGERAEAGSVRHGCERTDLSASFDIAHLPAAIEWLEARELSSEECLLRRVVSANGRSKAWINGQPVTIADLKALGELLIQVHGQHAHQALMREETHLVLLDDYAGLRERRQQLGDTYKQWRSARTRLKQSREAGSEVEAKRQLLRYQVEELDQLALAEGELKTLEEEQHTLAHAEETLRETQFAAECCESDDGGALSLLNQAHARLSALPGSDKGVLANTLAMLSDARIQVEEAAGELARFADTTELDPERLAWVDERLTDVHRIARKHHVAPEELCALHQSLTREVAQLEASDEDLETLSNRVAELRERYREQAKTLSEARQKAAGRLGKEVQQQLAFLAMGKARFEVAVSPRETPSQEGLDQVQFLISANPGQPARPLTKVASGGELSRISLAIQVVAASHSTIPSLVFDEVDVGISGATAEIVGQLLRKLGENGQVMTVTHLPQVAAQAHQHLHIEKRAKRDSTLTHMALLDEQGRISELARMLGGVTLSEQTLAHAREMLNASQRRPH
ncbi:MULTISPECIES: DNA repair protein RecN [unclassified Halomonas]|uniref:DNA repair protein RecN n=1 Tax=unclassified Halomonas TaxID=2609666 RepID=UPI00209CDE3D|nr:MULTISPECIES: DNA repair protein RecN [unclassified Halomonas]MCP1313937.1 DNA repair protein RecN [Halomonas sp. 707D7]MCP1325226.1 DNA repair protein RecN [Halomonas sp. 707D4]